METRVSLNKYRKSAQKAREVTRYLRGLNMEEALNFLNHSQKDCAQDLKKLIESAIANAKNNHNLKEEDLFIKEILVNEGATMKRWRARAYGRAASILKRTCSVELILDEKESVKKEKDEKIKEELKEIKNKEESKEGIGSRKENYSETKEMDKEADNKDKGFKEKSDSNKFNDKKGLKFGNKSGGKKVFRRKSF